MRVLRCVFKGFCVSHHLWHTHTHIYETGTLLICVLAMIQEKNTLSCGSPRRLVGWMKPLHTLWTQHECKAAFLNTMIKLQVSQVFVRSAQLLWQFTEAACRQLTRRVIGGHDRWCRVAGSLRISMEVALDMQHSKHFVLRESVR